VTLTNRWFWPIAITVAVALKIALSILAIYSYDFLEILRRATILYNLTSGHPLPMVELFHGLYLIWISIPLDHGNYQEWIGNIAAYPNDLASNILIFILKLPVLIFDLLSGLVIHRIMMNLNPARASRAFAFWILNPYVTLVTEMQGSIDIIPVFFLLLSVYFTTKRKVSLASLSGLLGTALKLFPIFFLPALVYRIRTCKRPTAILTTGFVVGAAICIYTIDRAGLNWLLALLSYDPFILQVNEILLTPYATRIGLASLFGLSFYLLTHYLWKASDTVELDGAFGAGLVILPFINYWPSYLLWTLPFFTLNSAKNKRWFVYSTIWLLSAFSYLLITFDFAGSNSLFYIPTDNLFMEALAKPIQSLRANQLIPLILGPILRSLFTAFSLYLALLVFNRNLRR